MSIIQRCETGWHYTCVDILVLASLLRALLTQTTCINHQPLTHRRASSHDPQDQAAPLVSLPAPNRERHRSVATRVRPPAGALSDVRSSISPPPHSVACTRPWPLGLRTAPLARRRRGMRRAPRAWLPRTALPPAATRGQPGPVRGDGRVHGGTGTSRGESTACKDKPLPAAGQTREREQ